MNSTKCWWGDIHNQMGQQEVQDKTKPTPKRNAQMATNFPIDSDIGTISGPLCWVFGQTILVIKSHVNARQIDGFVLWLAISASTEAPN